MAVHDFRQLCSVWQSTRRCANHIGTLAEILRSERGWCDYAECLHVLAAVVIEPMNGTTRNAECLAWSDINLFSVHSPGQHAVDAVDRLFIMVVAVGRSREALRRRDHNLEGRDAAT